MFTPGFEESRLVQSDSERIDSKSFPKMKPIESSTNTFNLALSLKVNGGHFLIA